MQRAEMAQNTVRACYIQPTPEYYSYFRTRPPLARGNWDLFSDSVSSTLLSSSSRTLAAILARNFLKFQSNRARSHLFLALPKIFAQA